MTWGETPMSILIPEHVRREYGDDLDTSLISAVDNKLKMAWQILKDETCPQCGQPIWVCHNPDREIGFNVDSTICYASKAIADHKKTHKGEDESWRSHYAKPFMYDDSLALPGREEYYARLVKNAEVTDDGS